MPIIATKKDFTSEPLSEGTYPARVYKVIHIGTVLNPAFGTSHNTVQIGFEFPTETKVFNPEKGEQPYVLSQDYTLSFGDKANLKKVIDACDPKALKVNDDGFINEYDVENLLGKTCLVTVIHKTGKNGQVYANVGGVTLLVKGMTVPPAVNPIQKLSYDNFDTDTFNSLPQFIKDKMTSTPEYKAMLNGDAFDNDVDPLSMDDIPDNLG